MTFVYLSAQVTYLKSINITGVVQSFSCKAEHQFFLLCCRDPYHLTKLLKELSPRHIIIYDPSVEFVRQVEIYKATNPERFLRVYFIFYDSSVEEQVMLLCRPVYSIIGFAIVIQ